MLVVLLGPQGFRHASVVQLAQSGG